MLSGDDSFESFHFSYACGHHCQHSDDEADSHALELRQAIGIAADPACNWDEDLAVYSGAEENAADVKSRHACGGEVEFADFGVHDVSLLHEEGGHLGEDH